MATDSATALSELQKFSQGRKTSSDYYKSAQEEMGVGEAKSRQTELRDLVRSTEQQLKGVGESVAGRTRGNLVTEAQRSRLQALEERPISESLSSRQAEYSDVGQEYRDLLSQASSQAGMMYQSDADKLAALESEYSKLREKEQADLAAEQWRKNFEESRAQAAAQLAESQRQFNENIAQTKADTAAKLAQIASLYTPSTTITATTNEDERLNALIAEANKITNAKSKQEVEAAKKALPKYQTGNFLSDYGSSITQYGPLALFGKGWAY